MTNFVLLYTGSGMPETEEKRAEVMAAWGAWYGGMGDAIVDGGNPFGAAKNISSDGINDGAFNSPPATGYTIISADSLDAAVEAVKTHPHIKYGGQVSIHETFQM